MAKPKTIQTSASVDAFIDSIKDESKREDCRAITKLMAAATGEKPVMWGSSIIGCGTHHYQYANGKPAEICKVGFSPRSRSFSFYLPEYPEHGALIKKLGKHKYSGGCLHVTRLSDVDAEVMEQMIKRAYLKEGSGAA